MGKVLQPIRDLAFNGRESPDAAPDAEPLLQSGHFAVRYGRRSVALFRRFFWWRARTPIILVEELDADLRRHRLNDSRAIPPMPCRPSLVQAQ